MPLTFQCPSCQATHTASDSLAGRRVRCPECDELVDVTEFVVTSDAPRTNGPPPAPVRPVDGEDDSRGTVALIPTRNAAAQDTVLLEAVDVTEAIDSAADDEVFEPAPPPPARPAGTAPPPTEEAEPAPVFSATGRQREETEMDMTPMVDVTFLLLIFFMVTAAFALQKSIEVPKPSDDQPSENVIEKDPEDNPDFVTVLVDEFNTYHVVTVDWEEEAPSVQDLHIKLRRARDGDSTGTVPTKLRVEAHGDALHGRVVAALDAGTATGFEEVQLTTVEEED